jgi:hypothetical protein
LTPEDRQRLWPPPTVLGNLHSHRSSAPSPVRLALEISCLYGTAGSVDPPPRGRRSPRFVLGVAQRRSIGAPPPSSGLVTASAR